MADAVKIDGLDRLQKHIAKMADPARAFDEDFARAARRGVRDLVIKTPKMTGGTSRGWTTPRKLGLSRYSVENATTTADKKHSLIQILDQGRGEVRPINAKRLYIPLSNRGRSKKAGAPIPDGFVYGVDYVLAKKAGPFKGKKFISASNEVVKGQLVRDMLATVSRVHGGK